MKKKCLLKIILAVILTITIAGIVLYSKNIKNFNLFQNRKNAINEKSTSSTTIDVTYLEDNGNLDHEHIIKTMYDENKHWEECIICGNKENIQSHSFKRTWTLGYESCIYTNWYTDICSCGYQNTGVKPCVWDGKTYNQENGNLHTKYCSNCRTRIGHDYYYNGKLYESGSTSEPCINSNGIRITCSTSATCYKCKTYRAPYGHSIRFNSENNEIYCEICNTVYGTASYEIESNLQVPATYTVTSNIILKNGATFDQIGGMRNTGSEWESSTQKLNSGGVGSTNISITTTGKFKNTYKDIYSTYVYIYTRINGRSHWTYITPTFGASPDSTKPVITDISNGDSSLTEWSKTKPIIVSGTENYCNKVTIKIIDEKGETIFYGGGNVSNQNYQVQCIPEVECDANGKTFTAIVTDNCGNSTEQEFTIAKVDAIPPTPISGTEILGDWAKSKDFTFTATDYGIGEVKIAFNDIEDLKLAKVDENTYSRDYKFIGDVYNPKQLSVLYKDGLGNTKVQKITIDKIDNTAPTITNATLHNNKLSIEANDEHEILGEGSGVVKYRYLASETKIINPELTVENSVESTSSEIAIQDIYKIKYIYFVAEDYVGNTSDIYEFEVPSLILTSKVNLNTADGKGEVILDWSSYDVTDKYFVIYRKKENETEWAKIVSLEQKLTGDTYTDIFGNDSAKPSTPNIKITGDIENDNIKITASSIDTGTKYTYYIEAYDNTGTLLSKSN